MLQLRRPFGARHWSAGVQHGSVGDDGQGGVGPSQDGIQSVDQSGSSGPDRWRYCFLPSGCSAAQSGSHSQRFPILLRLRRLLQSFPCSPRMARSARSQSKRFYFRFIQPLSLSLSLSLLVLYIFLQKKGRALISHPWLLLISFKVTTRLESVDYSLELTVWRVVDLSESTLFKPKQSHNTIQIIIQRSLNVRDDSFGIWRSTN